MIVKKPLNRMWCASGGFHWSTAFFALVCECGCGFRGGRIFFGLRALLFQLADCQGKCAVTTTGKHWFAGKCLFAFSLPPATFWGPCTIEYCVSAHDEKTIDSLFVMKSLLGCQRPTQQYLDPGYDFKHSFLKKGTKIYCSTILNYFCFEGPESCSTTKKQHLTQL